jgi:hypothetical protein
MPAKFLTTPEVCQVLKLSHSGVLWLERRGRLRARRNWKGWRLFAEADVLKLKTERLLNPPVLGGVHVKKIEQLEP